MSAEDTRRIGVGLLGFGVSGAKFHAPLIGAEPRLRLVALSTLEPEVARLALPNAEVTDRPEDVINRHDIELIVVATPNQSHAELARSCLLAGKHVVVDKPFTVATPDADALIELAAHQDRLMSVFHNRRWDGDFQTVRACIKQGALGEVRAYTASFDRYLPKPRTGWREVPGPGSGSLWDLGSHLIDQALVLFGLPQWVWASILTQREGALTPDAFHMVLHYERVQVVLEARSIVRRSAPRYQVHGDAGSFLKDGLDTQEAALKAGKPPGGPGWGIDPMDGRLTHELNGVETTDSVAITAGSYGSFYREMAAAILDGAPVPVDPAEARNVVRVIELAIESDRIGGRIDTGWSG